jgi:hypothetical protein
MYTALTLSIKSLSITPSCSIVFVIIDVGSGALVGIAVGIEESGIVISDVIACVGSFVVKDFPQPIIIKQPNSMILQYIYFLCINIPLSNLGLGKIGIFRI